MTSLLTKRRFLPLFLTQFFSAFNDNILKNTLVFLILWQMAGPNAQALVSLAGAVFIAPFFLFSALGGEIADRFDKAKVARILKGVEIAAAGIAIAGFYLTSVPMLFAALFAYGTISALFGPIKYGILPDHLDESELTRANALVETATFVAILGGTVVAGHIAGGTPNMPLFAGLMTGLAVLCFLASLFIPKTGEGDPSLRIDRNIFRSTANLLKDLKADDRLWWGGLVTSWFWLVGAVVLAVMPPMVKTIFNGTENVVTVLLAVFSVSIALGSGLAAWLAHGRIILLPTVIGALTMAAFGIDLGVALHGLTPNPTTADVAFFFTLKGAWRVTIDLAGIAISGGLFIVPTFAAIQAWAGKERRARVIAAVNVVNAAFMVTGGLAVAGAQALGLGIAGVFLTIGALTLVVAIAILKTLKTSAFADFLSIIYRTIFRTEVKGYDNIAKAGPNAIIALNHVSFLDAGLALSILEKDPVFAIDHTIAQRWWVKPFLRITRAMPLDPTKPMATRSLINAVKAGETLVIFPEGRLTVTGALMKVYDGAGLIAEKSGAMVVPVRLDGLEATPFSRLGPDQVRRRWFPKVTVTILEPVKLTVDEALKGKARRQAAGAALYSVMSDLIYRTTNIDRTVFQAVVEASEIHGADRIAVEDPITGSLTYKKLLIGARVLGGRLAGLAQVGDAVGVMLPNANAAAVTFLGLISAGRVPAMINFTSGPTNILAACKGSQVRTIVTSRGFVEKGRMEPLIEALKAEVAIVYLEDVRGQIGLGAKLAGMWQARTPIVPRSADDRAAILFTSGSEGTPKGVVLSNRNMLANAAQAAARIDFGRRDKVFNVLPVFHSFGLTVGLVLPLVSGVQVYLYPSPLHYRIVPELVYGSNATILFGTDTFLTGYARAAHPYDFRSLRYVLAGAEPVKETTRRTWAEKFGLRILEGYGVTETAPVLAINTPMFNRFGTVGRLMPGMEARLEAVPGVAQGGRLYVRGPNVMLGYLKADNPGVLEPPAEGWHDTGDIVSIDGEGFVTIRGRAKRFAKIGGEMISLAAIEALAGELWPGVLSAVGAIPDPRKGERLIMVTEKAGATRAEFQGFAKSRGASEMMTPAEVVVVDKVPILGSGKLDFAGINKLVRERASAATDAAETEAGD